MNLKEKFGESSIQRTNFLEFVEQMIIIRVCVQSGDRMDVIIMLIASTATAEHNSSANSRIMII